MIDLLQLFAKGGWIMGALFVLGLVLFERCASLLVHLFIVRRRLAGELSQTQVSNLQIKVWHEQLEEEFYEKRQLIRTLVAAAPLLGLLGTVIGMISTFESLVERGGGQSISGLADGISMALLTTETGLAIAIPAVLFLYYAQRQLQKGVQLLMNAETPVEEGNPA